MGRQIALLALVSGDTATKTFDQMLQLYVEANRRAEADPAFTPRHLDATADDLLTGMIRASRLQALLEALPTGSRWLVRGGMRFELAVPAAGALAASFFAEQLALERLMSFDMGGTTAKACLIEHGRAEIAPMMEAARVSRFTRGSGLPIKSAVIEMIEIGAGGGSIAAIDEVGLLKVGPHSASSDPGAAMVTQRLRQQLDPGAILA